MPDSSSPRLGPVWFGADIKEIVGTLTVRNPHSPLFVANNERALRSSGRLATPVPAVAIATKLHAELSGWSPEQIEHSGDTSWAACWDFPDQVDWYVGDEPEVLNELLAAIGNRPLKCGIICTLRDREFAIVYVSVEDPKNYHIPHHDGTVFRGLALAPASCFV
ncbi:MAG: hypothetical protein NUV56_00340 [Candidatus Uhrbacteria bacterium]|nr:hypothetical protein [Candidatus Uhrbacteria bacterium]